jgi:hypothetical protein
LLGLPLLALGAGGGTTVCFLALDVAVVAVVVEVAVTFLVAVARADFAFSTILVRIPAAPPAGIGFVGDAGRARYDFPGDAILVGGRAGDRACGAVREFPERGERTWPVGCFVRDAARGAGAALPRFLGFERSSFSLSSISSLDIVSRRLKPQEEHGLPVTLWRPHW